MHVGAFFGSSDADVAQTLFSCTLATPRSNPTARLGFGLAIGAARTFWPSGRTRTVASPLGLERLSPAEAAARGAGSLIVGVAPMGGILAEHWVADLEAALEAGLDVVSGMHTRLGTFPRLAAAATAQRASCSTYATRGPLSLSRRAGKRSGKRVLSVGTDCALGKKYTALALSRALRAEGSPRHVPRHRSDRHHDRRRGHSDGRGRLRFSCRRCGTVDARQRAGSLGRRGRSRLAAASRLCVRDAARALAHRLAAGRDRAPWPRPGAPPRSRIARAMPSHRLPR